MTEKVKITQEQADWLERYELTQDQIDHYIDIQPLSKRPDSPIVDWPASKVARAFYIGYEVEPEFEVGDWIARRHTITGEIVITKIVNIEDNKIWANFHNGSTLTWVFSEKVRRATPEEIAKEKERRWWAKHGRKAWELRRHDLISDKDGCSYTVNLIKEDYVEFVEFGMSKKAKEIKESFKVICFAEDRKDMQA